MLESHSPSASDGRAHPVKSERVQRSPIGAGEPGMSQAADASGLSEEDVLLLQIARNMQRLEALALTRSNLEAIHNKCAARALPHCGRAMTLTCARQGARGSDEKARNDWLPEREQR